MDGTDQNRRLRELNQALYDTGCLEVRTRGAWGQTEFQVNLKLGLTPHDP